jgi:hypothetical protein
VSGDDALIAHRAVAVAEVTAAAGTARLFSAWGAPIPQPEDARCEGVADFGARRARVWQAPFFTDGLTANFMSSEDNEELRAQFGERQEVIYDGANSFIRVAGQWTGFFLGDPAGPRGQNDPLWPVDALFGARDDAVAIGPEIVRDVPTTRCRLTLDLARADAALPAGVSVHSGPYRALSRLPAELWLDAEGLARRIAVVAGSETRASSERTWMVAELWDFGIAADTTPPAPGEVTPPREAFRDLPGPGAQPGGLGARRRACDRGRRCVRRRPDDRPRQYLPPQRQHPARLTAR